MTVKEHVGALTCIFEIENDEAILCGYEGNDSRVKIPDSVSVSENSYRVTKVKKKAFMGFKNLRTISLPSSICSIEEWAFAHCANMEKMIIRAEDGLVTNDVLGNVHFGKGVFEGCDLLESVCLGYEENDDFSILLGAAIAQLPPNYLLADKEIGKESWFTSWDKCLDNFLRQRDDEGSLSMVLCGEEDISYDGIQSVDGELLGSGTDYVRETRMKKAYLCFLRLNACKYLSEEYRSIFIQYIKQHGKNCKSEEAWMVLKQRFGSRIEFFKLYADLGCVDVDIVDDMLADMGEENAEAKAFLIKYKQDNTAETDFFSGLLL